MKFPFVTPKSSSFMSRRISIFSCYSIIYEIIWIFQWKENETCVFFSFFQSSRDAKQRHRHKALKGLMKDEEKIQMHVLTLLFFFFFVYYVHLGKENLERKEFVSLFCETWWDSSRQKMINIFSCEMANNFDEKSCAFFIFLFSSS